MGNTVDTYDGAELYRIAGPPGPPSHTRFADSTLAGTRPAGMEMLHVSPDDPVLDADLEWSYPSLLNGWTRYSNFGWHEPAYRKLLNGMVVMTGLVAGGPTGIETTIFVLPVGYRPAHLRIIPTVVAGDVPARMDVEADGSVQAVNQTTSQWFSLCASFWPDA